MGKNIYDDIYYMNMALEIAKMGCGYVNPNPMVGSVIVKNGEIVGQGYHKYCGGLHAERNAIDSCADISLKGASLFVTLEPCCHYGKTPPCTQAIIKSGISKVVVGVRDPNPLVSGKGIEELRLHGVEVVENVLRDECLALNEVFFHYIRTKTPYVVMKYAMTMDGKIATYTGKSKWITGEQAREDVHRDRHRYMAIMVGVGTVLADDPRLTCRLDGGKNPVRIICDTSLKTPLNSKVVSTAKEIKTILATSCENEEKRQLYVSSGCKVITLSKKDGHINLNELMRKLENIDSVLLEGGAALNWSALRAGVVNKVKAYIAPKLFGGVDAKTPVAGLGVEEPGSAFFLSNCKVTSLGKDFLIESEVEASCLPG